MRFLLDECISTRLILLLTSAGHDVEHVTVCGLAGRIDDEVLEAARAQERVLVSADTDFGELLARHSAVLLSLVLFRQGNRGAEHQARTLLENIDEIEEDLATGAIAVFTQNSIRIRALPIGRRSDR